jgi:hypothetical protein
MYRRATSLSVNSVNSIVRYMFAYNICAACANVMIAFGYTWWLQPGAATRSNGALEAAAVSLASYFVNSSFANRVRLCTPTKQIQRVSRVLAILSPLILYLCWQRTFAWIVVHHRLDTGGP